MSGWQKAQGAKCSCLGQDEMCPCQNVDFGAAQSPAPADEAEKRQALIDKMARMTDPRESEEPDEELAAFAWCIREAQKLSDYLPQGGEDDA